LGLLLVMVMVMVMVTNTAGKLQFYFEVSSSA
jgi:hypothetical protein